MCGVDSPSPPPDATLLMNAAVDGDKSAAAGLLPLVYEQLRKSAQLQMAGERPEHTLSATALVHEAYLRLVGDQQVSWQGRAHFFAAAAEAMRRILIEHARQRGALKRGGPNRRVDWSRIGDVAELASNENVEEILALDEAILRLEKKDAQAAAVVKMRFFAGLGVEHVAATLGISASSVK